MQPEVDRRTNAEQAGDRECEPGRCAAGAVAETAGESVGEQCRERTPNVRPDHRWQRSLHDERHGVDEPAEYLNAEHGIDHAASARVPAKDDRTEQHEKREDEVEGGNNRHEYRWFTLPSGGFTGAAPKGPPL
jgi:hypothetical protein